MIFILEVSPSNISTDLIIVLKRVQTGGFDSAFQAT